MQLPSGLSSWWKDHKGAVAAGIVAAAAAGAGVVVTIVTAQHVKSWHWGLAGAAAVLAGIVTFAATSSTKRAQTTTSRALQDAVDAAVAAKVVAEKASGELLDQVKVAEAQRASTAVAMAAVAGALVQLTVTPNTAVYSMTLAAVLIDVLPPTAAPLRITFLARRDNADQGVLEKEFALGHQQEVIWQIAPGSPDAAVAEAFAGPPWDGALLIDDVNKPEYRLVNVLVLSAPDGGVRSYCRAEVRYGSRQFGLLCADSWSDQGLTDADKRVIEAFAGMLAVGLALV